MLIRCGGDPAGDDAARVGDGAGVVVDVGQERGAGGHERTDENGLCG